MDRQRPFLVLTLRRTGGTSLMAFMARVSDARAVEHEPFNTDRVWGPITRAFRDNGDPAALESALDRVLSDRPNIKHCHEIIPWPVTRALIRACAARGYAVYTLTRRDERARLRSLFVAMATGAWGARQAALLYPQIIAGRRRPAPLRADSVPARFAKDRAARRQVDTFLAVEGIPAHAIVFEDLYARDGRIATRARALVAHMGVDVAADDPRLDVFAQSEGQGTGAILPYLANLEALDAALARLEI